MRLGQASRSIGDIRGVRGKYGGKNKSEMHILLLLDIFFAFLVFGYLGVVPTSGLIFLVKYEIGPSWVTDWN